MANRQENLNWPYLSIAICDKGFEKCAGQSSIMGEKRPLMGMPGNACITS